MSFLTIRGVSEEIRMKPTDHRSSECEPVVPGQHPGTFVEVAYLVARGFFWRRMMPASARKESFTASALRNTFATSASITTTFVPCA